MMVKLWKKLFNVFSYLIQSRMSVRRAVGLFCLARKNALMKYDKNTSFSGLSQIKRGFSKIIRLCAIIMLITLADVFNTQPLYAAVSSENQQCDNSCAAAQACAPKKNGSTYVYTASAENNGKCIKDKTADGCYDSNPTSCSGSYSSVGWRMRKNKKGETYKGNHLGSDIGSKACGKDKDKIQVYAPADGKVVWTGIAGNSGRTIVMEHDRKCGGSSGGKGGKYKTIFRHLIEHVPQGTAVKKGDPVGVEGGSNCYDRHAGAACLCDNEAQASHPNYTRAGCSRAKAYAIHLHIEVINSAFGGTKDGNTSVAGELNNVLAPYCGGIQALCGGCAVDLSSCSGSQGDAFDGTHATIGTMSGGSSGDYSGSYGSVGGGSGSSTCRFGDYLNSENCTFCELFKKLFNAASLIARSANTNFSGPTKTLVTIGFLIWMLIYVLRQITSFSQISTGEMLKGILFQGFRVAVVLILLGGAIYEVMDMTINPIMETGLSFGQSLNKSSSCDYSAPYMQNIIGYDETTGYPKPNDGSSSEVGGLSKHMGEQIICSLKNLEDSTGFLMSLGKYGMCIAWDPHYWIHKDFMPNLIYFSTGALLWLAGILLLLSFPWCLVDCILQLCIAVALIPCAVGAYAFKITSQYLKMIWNMFMNAVFNFVFMAIIVYIINQHLRTWIGIEIPEGMNPADEIYITSTTAQGLAWWGVGFFKILLICIFCWTFFDEAGSMANEFAKGMYLGNIGGKVGGTVSSSVSKVGLGVGAAAGTAALGTASAIGHGINEAVGDEFRNGVNWAKGGILRAMPGSQTYTNPDGSQSVTKSFNFMGRRYTRTITRDASGNYTQEKESHRRTNYEKYFKQTRDENGNVQYRERRSFLGMHLGMTKEMESHVDDETGNIVWESKDKNGRQRRIVTDANGNVLNFNTHSERADSPDRTARRSAGYQSADKGGFRTRELTDENGNVIGKEFDYNSAEANSLVEKDGTANMDAMESFIQKANDKEAAYEAIMLAHLQKRGQGLNSRFRSRSVKINDDGSVTITQVNNDGTTQEITGRISGNQMILANKTLGANGDPIRFEKSNGMQMLTETYKKEGDGTYTVRKRMDFSDYLKDKNSYDGVLSDDGEEGIWGLNVDRDQAMNGFTDEDYKYHLEQIRAERNGQAYTFHGGLTADDINERMN